MKALKHIIILHSDEEKKLCRAEVCVIVFTQEGMIQSIYSYVYSRDARCTGFRSVTSPIHFLLANNCMTNKKVLLLLTKPGMKMLVS